MPDLVVTVSEEQRQALLLALAKLTLERPGWDDFLAGIAERLQGRAMFEQFKEIHRRATGP